MYYIREGHAGLVKIKSLLYLILIYLALVCLIHFYKRCVSCLAKVLSTVSLPPGELGLWFVLYVQIAPKWIILF